MPSVTLSTEVNAPIARVFDVFTDLQAAPQRIPAITKIEVLTEGPVGRGTRFRETRTMFGKPATETMEFTEFTPGQSYTISANSCGALFQTAFRFRSVEGRTHVEQVTEAKPVTLFAKLMTPLSMLMMGTMKKAMAQDLESLKAAAERGA